MCSLSTLAPGRGAADHAPRRYASTIASPKAVPVTTGESLIWLPPVMKTAVAARPAAAASAGSSASSRVVGRTRHDVGGAEPVEHRVVQLDDLVAERGRGGADDDAGLFAARQLGEPAQHGLRPSFSSAPPIATGSRPGRRSRGSGGVAARRGVLRARLAAYGPAGPTAGARARSAA